MNFGSWEVAKSMTTTSFQNDDFCYKASDAQWTFWKFGPRVFVSNLWSCPTVFVASAVDPRQGILRSIFTSSA